MRSLIAAAGSALLVACGDNLAVDGGAGGASAAGAAGAASQEGEPGAGAAGAPPAGGSDADGDGYAADTDCDDRQRFVNPGAYEVAGDGVDNDCDGATDESEECDVPGSPIAVDTDDPILLARSVGLCAAAASGAGTHPWGVLRAYVKGAGLDAFGYGGFPVQHGVLGHFGDVIEPRAGASLLALSTGVARTPADPGWPGSLDRPFDDQYEAPPDGFPQDFSPCPSSDQTNVVNPIALHVDVAVPTNAVGASFDINFFTAEFPANVCFYANDTYVTLYRSIPASSEARSNVTLTPTGRSVSVDAMEFAACRSQTLSTAAGDTSFVCPDGPATLTGVGYSQNPGDIGAATGWISSKFPVSPGGGFSLDFLIWDGGPRSSLPSTVLIDNWAWIGGNLSADGTAH